jgi:hypothetical protein
MWPAREERDIETGLRHARTDVGSDCACARDQESHDWLSMVSYSCRSSRLVIRERGGDGAAANFPRRGSGDTLYEINFLRTFVFCQKLAAVFDECRLGGAMELVQDHGGRHFFT